MHSIVKALATGKNFLSRHKIMAAALVAVGLISVIAYSAQAITGAEIASAANPLNLLMVGLAIIINWIAWAVGKLIVIVIGMIVIPILGYNNFGDSNIINIGWPLVRDVVNMFVIIILLVIAIQTILGIAKASISQQLPRLFLAVIAVNFSRMFTVLMIDAGQVVMFTFVNALRDIAAGNFIGLFQINSFMGFSPEQSFNALTQGGISAGGFLGSAYITLSLLLMVLGVLLIMAVVFIYRIVILWILVILSPVAFFLAATKDILNTGPERYQEWWKKFVGAVTLGPILTFFLWLGLAAASSGSLAATEKFTLQQSSDSVGIYTEVFEVEKLTSLFIGLVLISTGLQVASGAAGALGGIAGKLVSEQTGTAGLKMALGAPAAVGARLGRAGAAGARFGARQVERRTGVGRGVGRGIIGAGAELRARGGLLGGLAGAALVKAGGGIERTAAESVKLAKGAAKERVAGMGLSEKVATLRSTDPEAKRLTAWSQSEIDKAGEATKEFVSDRSLQRQVRGDLERSMGETAGRKEFDNIMERSMRFMQRPEVQAELTDSERRNLLKTQTEHLDKVNVYDEAGEVDTAKTREAKKKIIEDAEFSNRNLSEAAIRDSDVQELLEGKVVRAYTDAKTGERVSVSAMDEVRKGIGVTREVTEAARGAGATFAESPAKMIEAALQNGYLKVEKLRPEDIRDKAGNIVPGRVEAFTRGAIQSEVDLSTMPTAVQSDFAKEADRQYKATTDPVEQRRIDRAEFSRTGQPSRIGIEADGRIRRGQHLTVREEISQRPESIVNLKVQVREGVRKGGNDVTKAITDNLKSADLEGLLKKYTEATTAEAQVDLRDAVWQVASAVESEMVRAKGAPSADLKKLRQKTSLVLGEMD